MIWRSHLLSRYPRFLQKCWPRAHMSIRNEDLKWTHLESTSRISMVRIENASLGAGGKLSTRWPPGRLVEHNSNPRGAVTNHLNDKENKTEQHNQHHSKHCPSENSQTNKQTAHSKAKTKLRTRTDWFCNIANLNLHETWQAEQKQQPHDPQILKHTRTAKRRNMKQRIK